VKSIYTYIEYIFFICLITMEPKYLKLRKFNLIMGVFHLIQAIAMYIMSNDFALNVTTSYLKSINGNFPVPTTESAFALTIGPWVASFLLLSALAHFFIASPLYFSKYVSDLKNRINYARWYEYSLSSSIMIVLIAMLSGIYDMSLLIALFGLNATMNLFGLMMELHNQTTNKINWTSFIYGCFAGIIPWIIIALHFFNAIADVSENVPTFVYFILLSLFIFFNIFPINMLLQYMGKGKWRDYYFGEIVYIILSLVAKSLLAWQVFGGTLRPQ
jgi:hypothetical protein